MKPILGASQVLRSEVFKYADLIGTPFEYGARPGESKALDCYGLVVECFKRMGRRLPQRQFAENENVISALMSAQMNEWESVSKRPGAVVLIKVKNVACHVGVMIDENRFIHAWKPSGGVCVEDIENWNRRIVGFYDYKGE